ncbi:MAG: hypothetical protein P8Y71_24245 [Pseudolabrys sp.]
MRSPISRNIRYNLGVTAGFLFANLTMMPARSIADLLDTIVIRWGGGGDVQAGNSLIVLKIYEEGRENWQRETLDWCIGPSPRKGAAGFLSHIPSRETVRFRGQDRHRCRSLKCRLMIHFRHGCRWANDHSHAR